VAKSDIIVRISGQADELRKEFRKITRDSEALNSALVKASRVSATAFAGLAGGIGLAVNQAAKFEQIESQFTVLTGSVDKAKRAIKDLSDFSAKTPFAFEDIANAGKQLISFGFEATEIKDRLQEIGDVAAATGQPIGDLSLIFGQVSAAGKLTGERLNQLQERAVPIGPAIAKTLGVAESAVRGLVSKGKVDFETFQKAFQSLSKEGGLAFKGLERQSNTLGGQISTLKDNFVLLTVDLGKQFLPVVKEITSRLIAFFNVLRQNPELAATAAAVIGVGAAVTGITAAVTLAATAFLTLRAQLIALNVQLGITTKLALAARVAINALGTSIKFLAKNPLVAVLLVIATLLLTLKELRVQAGAVFQGVLGAIVEFAKAAGKILSDLGALIKSVFSFDKDQINENFEQLKKTLAASGTAAGKAFQENYNAEIDFQEMLAKQEENLASQQALQDAADEEANTKAEEKLTRREELEQEHKLRMAEIEKESRDLDLGADLLYKQELATRDLKEKKTRLLDEQRFGKQNAAIKAFFRKEEVQNFTDTLSTLSTLTRSGNRTLFTIGKAAALARATINISEGITAAWRRGPILGPIGAAAVGLAGAVQIANISGATFQAAQGFSGSGSPFGERFVSTFTPREIVVPERFSEGIKKGEFALTRRGEGENSTGAPQNIKLEVAFTGDAAELIEVKKIEAQRAGVFINA
jgi:tape measure domain-containing protein